MSETSRRTFLKTATALAAGSATAGLVATTVGACAPTTNGETAVARTASARVTGFNRAQLDALGEVMLPASLGVSVRAAAVTAFVTWIDAYEPVAEEMHGYGYADVRYLPPDPAPAWRAQLDGLDVLARNFRGKAFVALDVKSRERIVATALRTSRSDRLPSPLAASHIALALLAHWASSPVAWNLALGVDVTPNSCRMLNDALRKPLPMAGTPGAKSA